MYCPHCLTEYRDGFAQCADCRVALMTGGPPPPLRNAAPELVTVLETPDAFAVGLAKASLEDAGIEYEIEGGDRGLPRFLGMATGQPGTALYRVQVAREDAAEARQFVEPLENPDDVQFFVRRGIFGKSA
jgi:hypothetical protein